MANEPERLIEKLLRACAKKRRDEAAQGPGFELHPATRRLLQGEVARRFPRREPARSGSAPWWKAAFWPRLVEACVLVALLAVVGYVLVPAWRHSTTDSRLAKNEAPSASGLEAKPSVAPKAPAPAAADAFSRQLADRKDSASTEAGALQKQLQASREQSNRSDADKVSPSALAESAPPSGGRVPDTGLAQNNFKLGLAPRNAPVVAAEPPAVATTAPTQSAPAVAGAPVPAATPMAKEQPSLARSESQPVDNLSKTFNGSGGVGGIAAKGLLAGQEAKAKVSPPDLSVATNALASSALTTAFNDDSGRFVSKDVNGAKKAEGAVVEQHFAQVPPASTAKAARGSKAAASVLASFQVQQAGRDLRVIDSDGSVYTGAVQTAEVALGGRGYYSAAPSEAPASHDQLPGRSMFVTDSPTAKQSPMRFFRVAGTNRSLNQPVVFSGSLSCLTNVVSGQLEGVPAGQATAGQPQPGLLPNSRISGQAVIGKNKVIQVNAVPAP